MKSAPKPVHLAIEFRRVEEMTDAQLQHLIDLRREEAELCDEIEAAVKANDRERAWQLCCAIAGIQEQVTERK